MYNTSLNKIIQRNLYALKRTYGNPVVLRKIVSTTTDFTTGQKGCNYTDFSIRFCIVLPVNYQVTLARLIALLTGRNTAPEGGMFDTGSRSFIIDAVDLRGRLVKTEDQILYDDQTYNILEATELEYHAGYFIRAKMVDNRPEIKEVEFEDELNVTEETLRGPSVELEDTLDLTQEVTETHD